MSEREQEMERLLRTLAQKIERERESRRQHDAAHLAFITETSASPARVDELRAEMNRFKAHVRHDEMMTAAAVIDARWFLENEPPKVRAA